MTALLRTSFAAALLAAAALIGCSSGSTVMMSGSKPATAVPVEQVRLYTETPRSNYQTVALITASAEVGTYLSIDRAEAAALDRLKEEAAEAGADGVMEIERDLVENGTVTSTSVWGRGSRVDWNNGMTTVSARAGAQTSTYVSRTIVFRAKAIRGGGPVTSGTSTASATTGTVGSTGVIRTSSHAAPAQSSSSSTRRRR